jgi:DNA-binding NarL/FixJ family response regulator
MRSSAVQPGLVALIADDHALFRQGLEFLLRDELKASRVEQAGDLETALEIAGSLDRLDLFAVDLNMPGMSGAESLLAAREAFPAARLVVVSASDRPEDITAALKAGADGYVPKHMTPEATVQALQGILRGEGFVPSGFSYVDPALRSRLDAAGRAAQGQHLTPRQIDVLRQLIHGKSAKEIARALNLGEGTVRIHLAGAYRALGARNRIDAVIKARSLPLFSEH